MADRRVKVTFSAEVQNYKAAMEAAAKSTEALKKASEDAGKATEQNSKKSEDGSKRSAAEIAKLAAEHQAAAKAAGLQYSSTGQLVTMNGKALSSQQAAAHGLQTFSQEAYLAGRAAVEAGEEAEAAAKATAEAEAKAAESAAKHRDTVERVGAAAAIAGAAVLAGVGLAVKSYADFDQQMSVVDSATHETAGNMELLRQAAIDAGADTAFSATEAAQGIEEMAKAGVSTKDILGGGLKGTLALAAAGALGVGDASEIAASAMTQFGLAGKDIPHIADLLAAGAGKAQGSVQDLGLALSYAGVPAHGMGVSIEETTGTLALFAKAGITGEKAGTALRSMLVSVVNPAAKTKATMDDLGISFSDVNGKFIGMEGTAQVLKDRLGGLDETTRNATLAQIFGNEALGAAQTLYAGGAEGVKNMTDAVNDYGYANDTASRMQNNLKGDLEKLGGSFDSLLIKSGGANDVLRGVVKGLEGLVDTVGKVPGPVLAVSLGLAAVVGGAALVGGALITVLPKIKATKDAFNDLAPAGGRARNALQSVGKAAGVISALAGVTVVLAKLAESDYMSKIDTGMGNVNNALADVTGSSPAAASALDGLFKNRDGGELIGTVTDLESAIKRTFNRDAGQQFNDWGSGLMNSMTGVKGSTEILADQFKNLDDGLAGLVSGGKSEDAAKAFDKIKEAAKSQNVSVEELTKKFPAYADALKQAEADAKGAGEGGDKAAGGIKAAGDASEAAGPSAEDLAKALEAVGIAADGSVVDIDKFGASLFAAGLLSLSASDASIAYQDAIDKMTESVKTNGTSLDLNTEKGRANQSAFNGLAQAAITSAEAHATETLQTKGSAAAQKELQAGLGQSYKDLITAAGQLGITGDAADTMARKALGIPKKIPIDTWVNDHASTLLEGIKGKADALNGKTATVTVFFQSDTSGYYDPTGGTNGKGAGTGTKRKGPVVYATGGRLPGYADGGQLPTSGPGTETTDGFLGISSAGVPMARVDAGEWIIKRDSSQRYNRELAAINAGTFPKLPGYANGGLYAAQSFGAASSPNVNVAAPAVTVMIGNEQLDARTYRVATSAIKSADSNSQYIRTGSR